MIKHFLCIPLFIIIITKVIAQPSVKLSFIHENKMILLKVPTIKNDTLIFLYDTGTLGIIMDSSSVKKHKITAPSIKSSIGFSNGPIKAEMFISNGIFKNDSLNKWFPEIRATKFPQELFNSKYHIDGIIGLNFFNIQKHTTSIDFRKNFLEITNKVKVRKNSTYFQMIYSDNGAETLSSRYHRLLPCVKVDLYFNDTLSVGTNLFIDTGCNTEVSLTSLEEISNLLSKDKVDSVKIKKVSFGSYADTITYFKLKGLDIGESNAFSKVDAIIVQRNKKTKNPAFGDLNIYGAIGAPFLARFKKVILDYPNRKIYFIP